MQFRDITVTKFAKIMMCVYKWNEEKSDLVWDAGLCTVSARKKTEVLWNCEQVKDEPVESVPIKLKWWSLGCDDVSGSTVDRLTDRHSSVQYNKQTHRNVSSCRMSSNESCSFSIELFTKILILVFSSSVQFIGVYYFAFFISCYQYRLLLSYVPHGGLLNSILSCISYHSGPF